eukprot:scaffold21418_cov27-Tisochrysis_lutea.AAC.1
MVAGPPGETASGRRRCRASRAGTGPRRTPRGWAARSRPGQSTLARCRSATGWCLSQQTRWRPVGAGRAPRASQPPALADGRAGAERLFGLDGLAQLERRTGVSRTVVEEHVDPARTGRLASGRAAAGAPPPPGPAAAAGRTASGPALQSGRCGPG